MSALVNIIVRYNDKKLMREGLAEVGAQDILQEDSLIGFSKLQETAGGCRTRPEPLCPHLWMLSRLITLPFCLLRITQLHPNLHRWGLCPNQESCCLPRLIVPPQCHVAWPTRQPIHHFGCPAPYNYLTGDWSISQSSSISLLPILSMEVNLKPPACQSDHTLVNSPLTFLYKVLYTN